MTTFPFTLNSSWVLLIVRLIVGVVMVNYGWPKIKDIKANAKDFVKMGFKPGWLFGTPIALLEFFGGYMVILGFGARIAVFFFALEMVTGTIWKIKTKLPFSNYSYDLLLLAHCLVILSVGVGIFALTPGF